MAWRASGLLWILDLSFVSSYTIGHKLGLGRVEIRFKLAPLVLAQIAV